MTVVSKPLNEKPTLMSVLGKGVVAAVVGAVINAVLFLIGNALGGFPDDALAATGDPITLGPVVIATLIAGLFAAIGYFVLTRRLTVRNANIAMIVLGAIILALMYFSPTSVENLPTSGFVVLQITHIVAGVLPIANLIR